MSTSAERAAVGRGRPAGRRRSARLRALPYDDPVAQYLVEQVQQEYVAALRRPRRGGRRPGGVPAARRGSSSSPRWTASRPGAAPGGRCRPAAAEIKRVYVEPAFRRRGLAQLIVAALEDSAARGRATGRSCSTPAQQQPEALALYARPRLRAGARLRRLRLRARTPCSWARTCAAAAGRSTDGGAAMGVVTFSAAYGAAGAEVAPGRGRAARACPSTTGRSRRRWPAGSGCRWRRRRPTTRPSSAGCGGWSPRSGRCPTRSAACCRRRRCPTRGPTGSRPSGCSRRSPTAPGEWCSAGPAAMVLRDRPDVLHVRLDGPRERRLEAAVARSGRPARRGPPRDGGQRPDPRGLRAALLPVRPVEARGTTTSSSTAPRCRWRRSSTWW